MFEYTDEIIQEWQMEHMHKQFLPLSQHFLGKQSIYKF